MSLGDILKHPQRFELPDILEEIRELDLTLDLLDLGRKGVREDDQVKQILKDVCEQILEPLLLNRSAEVAQISAAISEYLDPVNQELKKFFNGIHGLDKEEAIDYVLDKLIELTEVITKENIETIVTDLFNFLYDELEEGINQLFDEMIGPAIDELVSLLESDFISGTDYSNTPYYADVVNRFKLSKKVTQLRDAVLKVGDEIPPFTKEYYLDPLLSAIRNSAILNNLDKVREIILSSKEIADKILDLIKSVNSGPSTPGIGVGTYLWYPSWFLEEHYWEIDGKVCKGPLFPLSDSSSYVTELDSAQVSNDLTTEFSDRGFTLDGTSSCLVVAASEKWIISDTVNNQSFYLLKTSNVGRIKVFWNFLEVEWWAIEPMQKVTFKNIQPEVANSWAYHLSWFTDLTKVMIHALSMQPNYPSSSGAQSHSLSNLSNLVLHLAYSGLKLGGPTGYEWTQRDLHLESFWAKKTMPSLLTLASSLEGIHRNSGSTAPKGSRFLNWLGMVGEDLAEQSLFNHWCHLIQEGVLSYITLLNYDGPVQAPPLPAVDDRPKNRQAVKGLTALVADLATWIAVASFPIVQYGFPKGENPDQFQIILSRWLGLGSIIGVAAGFMGVLTAEQIAQMEDKKKLCKSIQRSLGAIFQKFPVYWYLALEGSTNYGRLSKSNSSMPGYLSPEGSPYKLPFPNEKVYRCIQGNMGLWGHNALGELPLIYAYDFALDYKDEVTAARSGIVWFFEDSMPDDTDDENNWGNDGNFIVILHNAIPSEDPLLNYDPNHDRNQEKKVVRTFAEYRHGTNEGVIQAFSDQGINILLEQADVLNSNAFIKQQFAQKGVHLEALGTQKIAVRLNLSGNPAGPVEVSQGDVIMYAGSTGKVAFNHLHLHVQPAEYNDSGDIIGRDDYTIPFVFQDVNGGIFDKEGVPKTGNYYQAIHTI